ncbi:hypothetical protein BV22DRAFT_998166, partial [Leucogyrophana mollusca]
LSGHDVLKNRGRGGGNGKHTAITESKNIAAIPYLGVQVFQHHYRHQFRSIPQATAL